MPELYFKGKVFVYNHHLTVPFRPLHGWRRRVAYTLRLEARQALMELVEGCSLPRDDDHYLSLQNLCHDIPLRARIKAH